MRIRLTAITELIRMMALSGRRERVVIVAIVLELMMMLLLVIMMLVVLVLLVVVSTVVVVLGVVLSLLVGRVRERGMKRVHVGMMKKDR